VGGEQRAPNPLSAVFAARLKAALDARNVTPAMEGRATRLAERLGRSVSSAARWLHGDMLPSLDTLIDLGTSYGVSLDYLVGLRDTDDELETDPGASRFTAPHPTHPILIVDDQSTARMILNEIAEQADQSTKPVVFGGPAEALRWASANYADLVIIDYRLPGMDGIEFMRHLRRLSHFADVPALMVTVVTDRELRYLALREGINDFLQKPIDATEGVARCRNLLTMSRQQAMLRDRSRLLAGLVEERSARARESERHGLLLLAQLAERQNGADWNHPLRFGAMASLLAGDFDLEQSQAETIEIAAALHDIGTLMLPQGLHPRQGTTGAEGREHAQLGYSLLRGAPLEPLKSAALIALGHHEHFDGTGYPMGLSGDHIPLVARIAAVADRADELWVQASEDAEAIWGQLLADRGNRLDPSLVDRFHEQRDRVAALLGRYPVGTVRLPS
jgi:two-component system, response regulator RpfG